MKPAAATGTASRIRKRTLLEHGDLPIASIAKLAAREGRRPRPIYGAHKWFARRLGVVFRSLLVSANLGPTANFWKGYYGDCTLDGLTVLDPFVGGGTSVVEARRLGASCVVVDVDPVACAVTAFELDAWTMPRLDEALDQLKSTVGKELERYHRAKLPTGESATVLHHFWVQRLSCPECEKAVDAHPTFLLAEDDHTAWTICAHCGEIERRRAGVANVRCSKCNETTSVRRGATEHGVLNCPLCDHAEPLIEIARRTGAPPEWHLFAQELFVAPRTGSRTVPIADRIFVPASASAAKAYAAATKVLQLEKAKGAIELPNAPISSVRRADNRIIAYGYKSWLDLFNRRQLLHLGLLRKAITELPNEVQRPLAIAYSNHLTTNCMMASYAAGWRRLTPLFSVRAFRHIQRPVEINPWVDGTGRGSFPNCVRKLIRAHTFVTSPKEPSLRGGFRTVPPHSKKGATSLLNRSSQDLSVLESESIDLVLTDPPYYDNINYSELSEFFAPWMKALGLTANAKSTSKVLAQSIAVGKSTEKSAANFAKDLGAVFREMRRVLKLDGLVVFTFRHTNADAWHSLAASIRVGGFAVAKVFPVPGESGTGLHTSDGTGLWDAVFVLRKSTPYDRRTKLIVSPSAVRRAVEEVKKWSKKLKKAAVPFTTVDANALKAALLVAEALDSKCARLKKRVPLMSVLTHTQE